MIVATLTYMSPEQAEGHTVDHRTDLFAQGVIFYELLTAKRPFTGDSPASVLSSIIKDAPSPLRSKKAEVPPELARLIQRCLIKEPIRRLQSALDFRNQLDEMKTDLDSGKRAPTSLG